CPPPDAQLLPEELLNYPATRLLIERATAAHPQLVLNYDATRSVTGICERLGGLPLALELAAARVTAMSLTDIFQCLDDRVSFLSAGRRVGHGRQQTMRATIDWSYSLLGEAERVVLRRLAVFSGGWSLEAAQAVCAGDSISANVVLDALAGLVDKSLVMV